MSHQLADDLIALRALLILRGRAVGEWIDADGRVCLVQGIDHMLKQEDPTEYVERASAMFTALAPHLPEPYDQFARQDDVSSCGATLMIYSDSHADDRDVFNLIDKALAELGAL